MCNERPCGPNSQCRNINGQAVCSCVPGYLGSPPNCRPECILSSDCLLNLACSNQKCIDPCPGTCGINAICRVVNHNAFCSCMEDLTGDPFTLCSPLREYQYFKYLSVNMYELTILTLFFIYSTHSASFRKSLFTYTLWTQISMSSYKQFPRLYMLTRISRITTKL